MRRLVLLLVVAAGMALAADRVDWIAGGQELRTFAGDGCGLMLLKGTTLSADASDPRLVWAQAPAMPIELLWRPGTRVAFGSPTTIVAANGQRAARVGEKVDLTGGFIVSPVEFSVCYVDGRWPGR